MTTTTLDDGRVLLVIRDVRDEPWLTIAALPTETRGLYVHEHTGHDEKPGWQISNEYGLRVPGWYDTKTAALACAKALGEVCPDWSELTTATTSKAIKTRAAAVIVTYHGEARS